MVGNPHRARIVQFELFELILLLKLDKQLPVEQFEATVSQSAVPSPPLRIAARKIEAQLWMKTGRAQTHVFVANFARGGKYPHDRLDGF